MAHPAAAAVSYWFVAYRRVWRSSVFSSFVIPVLWLTAIGLGVGGFVDADDAGLGVDYLSYLAPGLLASTVLSSAVAESSWPVYGSLKWNKQYLPMLASPLRVIDIVIGHLGFIAARLLLNAAAFFVAMAVFGTLHSPWAPVGVLAAVLGGLAVATPTYAFAATVNSENRFALLYRFGVVPVTLFSGVFFPIEQLPAVLLPLAWLSPLWHAVELCRSAALGDPTALFPLLHIGYLALWGGGGFVLARAALTRRLVI